MQELAELSAFFAFFALLAAGKHEHVVGARAGALVLFERGADLNPGLERRGGVHRGGHLKLFGRRTLIFVRVPLAVGVRAARGLIMHPARELTLEEAARLIVCGMRAGGG